MSWRSLGRRLGILALVLCFGFALAFAEEPWSLLGSAYSSPVRLTPAAGTTRVVSLNCGGGLPEAAAEVTQWNPEIVLLQEVPDEQFVHQLARRLYGATGGAVIGYDTAVLAREVGPTLPPKAHRFFVAAKVKLPRGGEADVVSLRLTPPLVRMDLWSPECWRQQRENREARRAELTSVVEAIRPLRLEVPLIVGGDFNAPAGDAVPAMLAPRLRDSFREAGRGWGNTGLNDIPVTRIDQVWISEHLRPRGVIAARTQHSDHRMVVCDLAANEAR